MRRLFLSAGVGAAICLGAGVSVFLGAPQLLSAERPAVQLRDDSERQAQGKRHPGVLHDRIDEQTPKAPPHDPGPIPQIPFGQTFKDFQFPLYQNGALTATLAAVSAKGITINRAETSELKIDLYTDGKPTTTITSPKADLYVSDRVMRTKNTVRVNRADMVATSQDCDFDLMTKKYLMRQNVHVLLKNFDVGANTKVDAKPKPGDSGAAPPPPPPVDDTAPLAPVPSVPALHAGDSAPDFPGASSLGTNAAPASPASP